jgi:L,D-transpeptidase-like protein
MKRLCAILILVGLVLLVVLYRPYIWAAISPFVQKFKSPKTVAQRLDQYGESARGRLEPHFKRQQISYPPARVVMVGFKEERLLELYAGGPKQNLKFIRSYPILRSSGESGPKLREGDRQVPEGIYSIESLNPNSRFHLSLRIGYPNASDRDQAARDGRTNLGGDIMIHGSSVSVGCLAMGDQAAEDLFVLAADTGIANIQVILSPCDPRAGKPFPDVTGKLPWTESLYATIRSNLTALPEVR